MWHWTFHSRVRPCYDELLHFASARDQAFRAQCTPSNYSGPVTPFPGESLLSPSVSIDYSSLLTISSNVYTEEEISPLFWMLGKLHCLLDNPVHLQQAAGTTKVGYNAYYDHKLASIQGQANYSGTRDDREFWVHDQTNT